MNLSWRKSRIVFGVLLALMVLLAGCAPAAPAPSAPAGGEAPAEEARGGDLVIAFPASSEPASLDGQIDPYQPAWLFDSFVADPLLVLGPDGSYQPALAESWEV